jgi:hypothetical protein
MALLLNDVNMSGLAGLASKSPSAPTLPSWGVDVGAPQRGLYAGQVAGGQLQNARDQIQASLLNTQAQIQGSMKRTQYEADLKMAAQHQQQNFDLAKQNQQNQFDISKQNANFGQQTQLENLKNQYTTAQDQTKINADTNIANIKEQNANARNAATVGATQQKNAQDALHQKFEDQMNQTKYMDDTNRKMLGGLYGSGVVLLQQHPEQRAQITQNLADTAEKNGWATPEQADALRNGDPITQDGILISGVGAVTGGDKLANLSQMTAGNLNLPGSSGGKAGTPLGQGYGNLRPVLDQADSNIKRIWDATNSRNNATALLANIGTIPYTNVGAAGLSQSGQEIVDASAGLQNSLAKITSIGSQSGQTRFTAPLINILQDEAGKPKNWNSVNRANVVSNQYQVQNTRLQVWQAENQKFKDALFQAQYNPQQKAYLNNEYQTWLKTNPQPLQPANYDTVNTLVKNYNNQIDPTTGKTNAQNGHTMTYDQALAELQKTGKYNTTYLTNPELFSKSDNLPFAATQPFSDPVSDYTQAKQQQAQQAVQSNNAFTSIMNNNMNQGASQ